jgi:hypothetical protein
MGGIHGSHTLLDKISKKRQVAVQACDLEIRCQNAASASG